MRYQSHISILCNNVVLWRYLFILMGNGGVSLPANLADLFASTPIIAKVWFVRLDHPTRCLSLPARGTYPYKIVYCYAIQIEVYGQSCHGLRLKTSYYGYYRTRLFSLLQLALEILALNAAELAQVSLVVLR